MDDPRLPHLNVAHKILSSIKRTPAQGLLYRAQTNLQLIGYLIHTEDHTKIQRDLFWLLYVHWIFFGVLEI